MERFATIRCHRFRILGAVRHRCIAVALGFRFARLVRICGSGFASLGFRFARLVRICVSGFALRALASLGWFGCTGCGAFFGGVFCFRWRRVLVLFAEGEFAGGLVQFLALDLVGEIAR
jgi:hypothetical protein